MPRLEACLDFDSNYIDHLKTIKVFTVYDFINVDTDKLTYSNLTAKDILSLKHKLLSQYSKCLVNAAHLYRVSLKKCAVLRTNIENLDELLNGGLETGLVYEFTGLSGSGKTQMCLTIAANVVSKLKRKVFYLDSKNDFSSTRVDSILASYNLSNEDIFTCLNRITVFRIADIYDIFTAIQSVREMLKSSGKYDYRLLIVDSMTSLFLEFIGSQQSNEGFSLLIEAGLALKNLAREMHLAIVITNLALRYCEVDSDIFSDEPDITVEEKMRPAMGRPWSHIPHCRISLQSTHSPKTLSLTIVKSNCHPVGKSTIVGLSSKGIT